MFKALTKYLLQYDRVSIPFIGSFEIVHQPAVLNIAEKEIHPPVYYCKHSPMEAIHQHQLQYLSLELEMDLKKIGVQLESFGKALLREIKNRPFEWKGLGVLEERNAAIIFTFDESSNTVLEPVEANKVLREKRQQHLVLVGEREVMANTDVELEEEQLVRQRYLLEIIGGAVALIALIFIIYYLYQHQFSPMSTGADIKFTPVKMAPLNK